MKKIFLATEQYKVNSDDDLWLPVIIKIIIFDFESQKVYFSFKIKNNLEDDSTMKKNFLYIQSMMNSYELENSRQIDDKKAEKILSQKIKNLNGFFLHDFCKCYEIEELAL